MSEAMKRPAIGIENFEEMRKLGFYYVDKTGLIADLMAGWGKVNLFTRPRRFGKTLNMSMLKYFFEIGSDKSLFDGLAISRDTELCDKYMGRYPVVSITLKGVHGSTFETAFRRLRTIIRKEARRHQYLLASDRLSESDKHPFEQLFEDDCDEEALGNALLTMSELLEKHYGQKAIILIDEYDVPLDKAYREGYYDRMTDLIRALLGAALKDNNSMFFAVLTGCLRVSRESIFTGLNNLRVHSISDLEYDEYFGFTDREVGKMLDYYGFGKFHDEVREWYDGYRFGGQKVYCPWDVINYCEDLRVSERSRPKAYWINSSSNDVVRSLLEKGSTSTTQREVEVLIEGGEVVKVLNESLTYGEIDESIDNIWSLLYMTGYLTAADCPDGERYRLRIPNREVREIYKKQVLSWFRDRAEKEDLAGLYAAFEHGDTEAIARYLNEQLLTTVSFYDAKESFYHGFLAALLNTCADWYVTSNAETGKGRSDIIVERADRRFGFVVEVKNVRDERELDAACAAAMRQIEEMDYTANMRRCRFKEVWTYGIAFCGKECRVAAKRTPG